MHYIRNRHFLLLDIILLAVAVYVSFVLRLEHFYTGLHSRSLLLFTVVVLAVFPILFRQMGIYSRYWQYASIDEVILLTGTVTLGTLLAVTIAYPLSHVFDGYPLPRSIPLIFLLIAIAVTAGPRLFARVRTHTKSGMARRNRALMRPVLIVGAGHAGKSIAQELYANPQLGLDAVGFLDDNSIKWGS